MAKQFNPFHHWLGFENNVVNPNHFQLFGVKPNSDDPIGFRKQVHTRAKAMLKQLEEMTEEEVGGRVKLHKKLRRHIVRAHDTLLDSKLQAAYLKSMRQKAREAKGSAKPLAVPPPKTTAANTKATTPSTNVGTASKAESFDDLNFKKPPLPQSKPAAIPMAIPLQKPATSDEEVITSNSESDSSPNFDNLSSEEIVIKPARIKRKRSWLLPILMLIMTLFCVAVIGGLVRNFSNILAIKPTVETNTTTTNIASTEKATEDTEAPSTPENKVESSTGHFKPKAEPKTKAEVVPPADTPAIVPLTDSQLHSIRFLFERARKEMVRGRLKSASEQYSMAESIVGDGELNEAQAAIASQIKTGHGMIKHLEGFWEQVARSSQKVTGGELEPEPGVFIGFVEGRANDVVLRFGENVAIPYRSLRPGLAMKLAPLKAIPNVPAWRIQDAAFRLIHSNGSDESKAKIDELLAASEAEQYDTSAVREFMNTTAVFEFPKTTTTAVTEQQMSEMTRTLVDGKYENISELKPRMARRHAQSIMATVFDDPKMQVVALNETVNLAQQSGDGFLMIDAIDELAKLNDFDSATRKLEGFTKIVKKQPQGVNARLAGEAFFEFLKSEDAKALPTKKLTILNQQMLKMVTSNGLDDLRRLITQKMN